MEDTTKASEKFNWVEDFGINEMLHGGAQELSGTYSRLLFNNPAHPQREIWKRKGFEWSSYDRSIKNMVFYEKETGEKEINKIADELKMILILERELVGKQNRCMTEDEVSK